MREPIDREQFAKLFQAYEHTAFRLETRDRYNEAYTQAALERYRVGEPVDYAIRSEWTDNVRAAISVGKRMKRVRVVSEPLTEYSRYSIYSAKRNIAAGEDIRYLPRDQARDLGLPEIDYWLFDSDRAAVLKYDDDDRSVGSYDLITDPEFVVRCNQWRDAAWHFAITRDEFATRHGVD